MSNTINIKCGLKGKIPLTPFTKRGMKSHKSLYKTGNWHPRGVVSIYFMVITIIIFAFIALTMNFWLINYSKISLQCAADLGAVSGAETQAKALNKIARSNGETIRIWNKFRKDYYLNKNCHSGSKHHFYHYCPLPNHEGVAAKFNAIVNVCKTVKKYLLLLNKERTIRFKTAKETRKIAKKAATDTALKNLKQFFNPSLAKQCKINAKPTGFRFKEKRFNKKIKAFYHYWKGCSGMQHNHFPNNETDAITPDLPLWWEKDPNYVTYTRVSITIPIGKLNFLGSRLFGKSPTITAVAQARPYGGYCYLRSGISVDARRAYPYYRSKLFSLRRKVNPDVGYPAGSRTDYYH